MSLTSIIWNIFFDTQHFGDEFPVSFKIGHQAKLIETLQSHDDNKYNGGNLFHDAKLAALRRTLYDLTHIGNVISVSESKVEDVMHPLG